MMRARNGGNILAGDIHRRLPQEIDNILAHFDGNAHTYRNARKRDESARYEANGLL